MNSDTCCLKLEPVDNLLPRSKTTTVLFWNLICLNKSNVLDLAPLSHILWVFLWGCLWWVYMPILSMNSLHIFSCLCQKAQLVQFLIAPIWFDFWNFLILCYRCFLTWNFLILCYRCFLTLHLLQLLEQKCFHAFVYVSKGIC
jgi:hypothetical protein